MAAILHLLFSPRAEGCPRLALDLLKQEKLPEACLRHVLERIVDHPINRVDELLPWAVADKLQAEQKQQLAACITDLASRRCPPDAYVSTSLRREVGPQSHP